MSRFALSPFELLVVVLAAYRATRLLVKDSLFETSRDRIIVWSVSRGEHARRYKLGQLVECPYCLGTWLSWLSYVCAVLALDRVRSSSLLAHMIAAWAVAGGQALLNALDAVLNAENQLAHKETDE